MGFKKEIFYNPLKKEIARKKFKIDQNKFLVIFHGFYYINYANKEAIDKIKEIVAPSIKDDDILFLLAGKMPNFKDQRNLRYLGYVEDLKDFLYAADIAIVPIFRGSGIRIKMIDYLSACIPIITTEQAALGLTFKNNIHGYIVNNQDPINDMIDKIIKLKNNPDKVIEFKNNIRKLLLDKYDWNEITKVLEKKYLDLINRK